VDMSAELQIGRVCQGWQVYKRRQFGVTRLVCYFYYKTLLGRLSNTQVAKG